MNEAGLPVPFIFGRGTRQRGDVAELCSRPCPFLKAVVPEQIFPAAHAEEKVDLVVLIETVLEPVLEQRDKRRSSRAAGDDHNRTTCVLSQIETSAWRAEAHLISSLQLLVDVSCRNSRRNVFPRRRSRELDHQIKAGQPARTAGKRIRPRHLPMSGPVARIPLFDVIVWNFQKRVLSGSE